MEREKETNRERQREIERGEKVGEKKRGREGECGLLQSKKSCSIPELKWKYTSQKKWDEGIMSSGIIYPGSILCSDNTCTQATHACFFFVQASLCRVSPKLPPCGAFHLGKSLRWLEWLWKKSWEQFMVFFDIFFLAFVPANLHLKSSPAFSGSMLALANGFIIDFVYFQSEDNLRYYRIT